MKQKEAVMSEAGERRRRRKAAVAAGRSWTVETGPRGLEVVRERTAREERAHERRLERWARRWDMDGDRDDR